MKPRTVAIIQARMGSARFPGKMLAPLGGRPLLEWVLRRVGDAKLIDEAVLATSREARDDSLAALAAQIGVQTIRGDESDVLGRYVAAAQMSKATWVVRVCADNPFIDPGEIDRLIDYFSDHACDYACNHMDRLGSRYADGFGAEILSADLLRRIAGLASETRHREHVTLYLWDHAPEYRLLAVPAPSDIAHPEMRFDVDTPADLTEIAKLVALGVNPDTPATKIIALKQARSVPPS